MAYELLLKEVQGLPEETLNEILNYVLFLKSKNNKTNEEKTYRKAGILKGKIKMSDDFDDPLEEFEEYM